MAIVNPNIDGSVTDRRWALKKHTIFKREFAERGTVDLSGGGTYTDLDGDSWTLWVVGAPDTFQLGSTGIYMQNTGAVSTTIGINPASIIPGLRARDPMWAIWKVVDVDLPNNDNTAQARYRRRTTAQLQQGGWQYLTTGGNAQLNPIVTSAATGGSVANTLAGGYVDDLLSINVNGLRYEYRKQLASADFPSTPDPDDIDLFTSGSFDGVFSGEVRAAPTSEDVDVSSEIVDFKLDADGAAQCEITLEEFWLYRWE